MSLKDDVYGELRDIVDPCSAATGSSLNLVEMGLIKSVELDDGHVDISMRLTTPACHMLPYFYEEIEGRVGDLPAVTAVNLKHDDGFEWHDGMMTEAAKEKRRAVFADQEARFRREQGNEDTRVSVSE